MEIMMQSTALVAYCALVLGVWLKMWGTCLEHNMNKIWLSVHTKLKLLTTICSS